MTRDSVNSIIDVLLIIIASGLLLKGSIVMDRTGVLTMMVVGALILWVVNYARRK